MRKLLLVTAALMIAAPAMAQQKNAPSDQSPSRDPSPQIQTDINRDAQQSGGGAARSGQGGQTTGSGAATQGQGGGGAMQQGNPSQRSPDLPPRRTPDGSTGMPNDTRGP